LQVLFGSGKLLGEGTQGDLINGSGMSRAPKGFAPRDPLGPLYRVGRGKYMPSLLGGYNNYKCALHETVYLRELVHFPNTI